MWATEDEAIKAFDITVEHCGSCHASSDVDGLLEVTLPDGRVAEVCCTVAIAIQRKLGK